MAKKRYTPDVIAEAERAVGRIQGVSSCRIHSDDEGRIKQVDVVATTRRSPKLVARDVEDCMKDLNVPVEYKKINVVVFEGSTSADRELENATRPAIDENGVARFPLEEYTSRYAFQSVNVFQSQDGIQAEVELARDGVETFGTSRCSNPSVPQHRVVAEATLNAIAELLDDPIRLCLSDVIEIEIGGEQAVVAKVDVVRNRETKTLAGCSLYARNSNQTTVFATLDAVNRILGVLGYKDAVEYRIK